MSSDPQTQRTPRRHRSPLAAASVAAAVLLAGGGSAYWAATAGDGGGAAGPGAPLAQGTPPLLSLDGFTDSGSGGTEAGAARPSPTGSAPPGIAPGEPDPHGGGPWGRVVYRAPGDLPQGPASAPVHRAQGAVDSSEVARLARALGVAGTPRLEGGSWLAGEVSDGSGAQLRVNSRAPGNWTFARPPGPRESTGCAQGKVCTAGGPVDEAAAKKAAAPVLEALGLRDARLDAGQVLGGSRVVNADPVVGGLPTYGWTTGIPVGSDGRVAGGSGYLKGLTKGADYPVVGAAKALDLLNRAGGARLPDIGGCATPVPHKEQKQGAVVEDTAPGSPQGGILPCEPRQDPPRTVTVASATFALAVQFADGQQMLVPSWLFEVRPATGEKPYTVTYPAVDPKYLTSPKPPVSTPPQDPPKTQDRHIESYRADGRKVALSFWGGVCSDYAAKAVESDGAVRVRIVESNPDPKRVCIALAKKQTVTVTLEKPLDGRRVLGEDGKAVPRG
ncbi:hypothetical protein [Streptomyces sp. NPDC058657]|uniref:hypothetical protein n=1 Tax=unclassified Streptomyces TaxID=2593676 RepID=UPI0036688F64